VDLGASELRNQLAFEEAEVDTESCGQWVAVDKTTFENTNKTDEFIDLFSGK
jgi:hypothetical protein